MTNEERIIEAMRIHGALDDDELCLRSGVQPRQQVNQICRRLERRGIVRRVKGPAGKLINGIAADQLHSAFASQAGPRPAFTTMTSREVKLSSPLDRTLLIIPCSGVKRSEGGPAACNKSWLDDLPSEMTSKLIKAREAVAERAHLDTSNWLPACQRYGGSFYKAAGNALSEADKSGLHVLIISGGYGLVSLRESIGRYEAIFNPAWWPSGLLEQIVISYIKEHGLCHVRAFLAATTPYRRFVQNIRWSQADVKDAILLAPVGVGGGAMVKTPRALGEAVRTALSNKLTVGWMSSDRIQLQATSLVSTGR